MGRNNKARFRGDVQIDGRILGSDGQPIDLGGGGGSFDPTIPIPELHFAGDPSDDTSGMKVYWDQDWWGLAFSQPPGADDAEIYLWADVEDDPTHSVYTNLWPGGISIRDESIGGFTLNSRGLGWNINNDSVAKHGPDIGMVNGYGPLGNQWKIDGDQGQFFSQLGIMGDQELGALTFKYFNDATYHPRYKVDHDGKTSWGSGADVPDTMLQRTAPGTLEIDHTLAFKAEEDAEGISIGREDIWDSPTYVPLVIRAPNHELDVLTDSLIVTYDVNEPGSVNLIASEGRILLIDSSGRSVNLSPNPFGAGLDVGGPIETAFNIVVHSDDGTRYKLEPPNGGGPAEWVAA